MAMVKCSECGKEKSDEVSVCPHCGYMDSSYRTNSFAIAGFVLSFFVQILGLVFSIIALAQISRTNEQGKGLAIAGIIISALSMIIGLIFLFIIFIAAAAAGM